VLLGRQAQKRLLRGAGGWLHIRGSDVGRRFTRFLHGMVVTLLAWTGDDAQV
jgi:hypothetical protein